MVSDLLRPRNQYPVRRPLNQFAVPAGMGREQFRAMGTTITLLLPQSLLYAGAQVTRQLFGRVAGAVRSVRPTP